MIGALVFNIIAVFLSWLEGSKKNKHGLKLSLFVVFLFLAIRYDYGNDYFSYFNTYIDLNTGNFKWINNTTIKGIEIGWILLNRIFGFFGVSGFFCMIAFLSAFSCTVVYKFIKKYVPARYYWFAVFFYVFNFETMLIPCSAMRQAVSITFFILAFDCIVEKKLFRYIFLILCAMLFHTSAIFLLPLILLRYNKWKVGIYQIIVLMVIFILAMIKQNEIRMYINQLISRYFSFYEIYSSFYSDFSTTAGLGFVINIIIYTYAMIVARKDKKFEDNLLTKIVLISIFIIPLILILPLITRLNYYLLPIMMIVFPTVFSLIKNKDLRFFYMSFVIAFTLYTFVAFIYEENNRPYYEEYKTIFSSQYI